VHYYDLNSACVCVNHAASVATSKHSQVHVAGPLFGARPTSCSFGSGVRLPSVSSRARVSVTYTWDCELGLSSPNHFVVSSGWMLGCRLAFLWYLS